MSIDFKKLADCKKITKPWGHELWLQPGSPTYPFVLKQLLLKKGNRTSLQVHQFKSESIIILSGFGNLLTYDEFFDCEKYLSGCMTSDEISHIVNNLRDIKITERDVFHTPPGTLHRMVAVSDLVYIEASTQELDDVIRIHDDQNRDHGRINAEH